MKSSVRFFILHACGLATIVALAHATMAADTSAFGNSVAAQRDGKIVVAGSAEVSRGDQFALVRYNSDGSRDTTLNGSGKVTTAVGIGYLQSRNDTNYTNCHELCDTGAMLLNH